MGVLGFGAGMGEADRTLLRPCRLPVAGPGRAQGATAPDRSYTHVVVPWLGPAVRVERLRQREAPRYGKPRDEGRHKAGASAEFLRWAEAYDTAALDQRSLIGHATWLATLKAPVL